MKRSRLTDAATTTITRPIGSSSNAQSATITPSWQQLSPTNSPPARNWPSMIWDGGTAILFGGFGPNSTAFDDTWQWDGTNWTQLNPVNKPPARGAASMVSLGPQNGADLFGGANGSLAGMNDFWHWSGSNWASADYLNLPNARMGACCSNFWLMGEGFKLAVISGYSSFPAFTDSQLWYHDAQSWRGGWSLPSARAEAPAVYDGGRIILFGGQGTGGRLGDTWEWTYQWGWAQLSPAHSPPARSGASMVWAGDRAILFGGFDVSGNYLSDTWAWNGSDWTEITTATSPPGRDRAAMIFDGQRAILFGGQSQSVNFLDDTWALTLF